ncbi:hypothetical protein BCR44DRAFT_1427397 [Catenaria anguillulae PL171]|uniref:G-protein coupled receptors family 3 profile domain-containing protein n=1 Tax=Catenaria anguillulae PL171 TaxID=765915 RepID=A0A1Y2HZN6_9FUNG|nr:hypothetical protein BCR44DRAFT_1427397 [Catenaria anguillulae PL171]
MRDSNPSWGLHSRLCSHSATTMVFWILILVCLSCQLVDAVTTVRVLVPGAFNQDNWNTHRNITAAFAARTGIQVEFVTMVWVFDAHFYVATAVNTMFSSKDGFVDIFALDVVWIGDYGEYLMPLDGDAALAAVLSQHNPQNVAAGMYGGQLKAVPQSADYGVLYSRMDLLNRYGYSAPPTTTNPAFVGLTNQVSAYEGLTCNALEWTYAEDAGVMLEPDRTLSSFDQTSAIGQRVLAVGKRIRRWQANGWMSIGLTEGSSGREWIRGNALFMRNWPHMSVYTFEAGVTWPWRLTRLPTGAATLGGWLWGANKYTNNPNATKQVLGLFASTEWQRSRAVLGGAPPTIPTLYNDPDVCNVLPVCEVVQQLKIARRPSSASGVKYPEVSKAIYTYWFDIARGSGGTVESILDTMNREIAKILDIDILGPATNVAAGAPAVAAFGAVAGIEIVLLVAALGWFVFLSKTPVVRNIGLAFLGPVTVGLMMQLVVVFLTVGVPNSATCQARFWIHGMGYSLAVVSVCFRLFRLWSISWNPFLTDRSAPTKAAAVVLAPSLLVSIAILIGFSVSNAIGANEIKLSRTRYFGCVSADPLVKSTVHIVWYCWLGAQMLAACFAGIKASKLTTAPPESRALTVCIANAAFVPIILIPFVDLDLVDQPTVYILRSLTVVFPIGLFIGVYLAPRAWLALQYWRDPAAAAEKDSESHASMMGSTMTTGGNGLSTFAASAAPGNAGGKGAHNAGPTVQASAIVSLSAHGAGAATPSTATGQQAPAVDLKKLVQVTLKTFDFGCEGIATMRSADRAWLLPCKPWTLMRVYLLQKEGLLVLQHLSSQSSVARGTSVPLSVIKTVTQTSPNEFALDTYGGLVHQLMVSTAEDTKKWVGAIESVIKNRKG